MRHLIRLWRRLWWAGTYRPAVGMNREMRRRDARARARLEKG